MTPDYTRFVDSSFAAERAGDAETALEFHSGVPMFARGAHKVQLTQLAGLTDEMTPWMWARWAAYQCTRTEDRRRAGELQRSALQYTVEMFYPDRLQDAFDAGGDPVQVLAHVMGESWLMHQLCTFDFGGLAAFIDDMRDRPPGGELRDRAGVGGGADGRLSPRAAPAVDRWSSTTCGRTRRSSCSTWVRPRTPTRAGGCWDASSRAVRRPA